MLTAVLSKITLAGPQNRTYGKMLDQTAVRMPQINTHTHIHMKPSLYSTVWQIPRHTLSHLSVQAKKFAAGQRASRCMIQMSCPTNLTDVSRQQHSISKALNVDTHYHLCICSVRNCIPCLSGGRPMIIFIIIIIII